MSALLITMVLCAGADKATPAQRGYHEIERDISAALKCEAKAKNFPERASAVCQLAALHDEVRRDARCETSDALAGYQTRLRGRLLKVKKDLLREVAKNKPTDGERTADADLLEGNRAESQTGLAAPISSALATQLDWFASEQGGPAKLLSDGGRSQAASTARGGGAAPDSSADLIDLIERTISPEHWDVNGGPGAIVYYQPLQVLVIRASSEVHGRVGGLVGGLRAAGP